MFTSLISVALIAGIGPAAPPNSSQDLPDSSSVKAAFNAAKGKVRIVMLVSPTCPACVCGADIIKNDVLAKVKDKRLATFSVYIPMIFGDGKAPAVKAAKEMTKIGVPSFWDGKRELGNAYGQVVKLPMNKKTAWDIYFIYGPDAVWSDTPPKPVYWMHQLGDDDLCLDGNKFRAAVEKQLKALK